MKHYSIIGIAIVIVVVVSISAGAEAVIKLSTELSSDELAGRLDSDAGIYYSLGTFLAQNGYMERAAAVLSQAVDMQTDFSKAHYNLGVVHYRNDNLELAEKELLLAVEGDDSYSLAWFSLGVLMLEEKRYEDAIIPFEKVTELDATFDSWFNLGLAYAGSYREGGDISYAKLAKESFENALAIDPDSVKAKANVAVMKRFV